MFLEENVYKSEDEEKEGINRDSYMQTSQYEWYAGATGSQNLVSFQEFCAKLILKTK